MYRFGIIYDTTNIRETMGQEQQPLYDLSYVSGKHFRRNFCVEIYDVHLFFLRNIKTRALVPSSNFSFFNFSSMIEKRKSKRKSGSRGGENAGITSGSGEDTSKKRRHRSLGKTREL